MRRSPTTPGDRSAGRRQFIRLAGASAGGLLLATTLDHDVAVAATSMPASDVDLGINLHTPLSASIYPTTMSLQDYLDSVFVDGLIIMTEISSGLPSSPTARQLFQSRATFATQYTAQLSHDEVGSNGVNSLIVYGNEQTGASGFANIHNIFAVVRNSVSDGSDDGDPARNEVGGIIAAMRMGDDADLVPPRATFWGTSFSLRGGWRSQEPGGLAAYTAVMQNHFDGPGSRFDHYGYAAVTWPGIGDGDDFWNEPGVGDRYARTFPIPFGFIVAGQSGDWHGDQSKSGGEIGFQVGVQSGGWATPWRGDRGAGYEIQPSKIGVGFRSIDWIENGIHVGIPHLDASLDAASLVIDVLTTAPTQPIVARRTVGPDVPSPVEQPIILADGRVKAPLLVDPDDAVSAQTLGSARATAVGTVPASIARQGFTTASMTSIPSGVVTIVGPWTFPWAPALDRFAIDDLSIDVGGGPANTVDGAVQILLAGEYEATIWADWEVDTSGAFRLLSLMTLEELASYPKTLASSYLAEPLVQLGHHDQDAYQATVRVRIDELGKPLFAVVVHDATTNLDVNLSMLVKPVLVDESSLS